MHEAIVKGEHTLDAGLPESFNVLIKELQALCLNVELIEGGKDGDGAPGPGPGPGPAAAATTSPPRSNLRM